MLIGQKQERNHLVPKVWFLPIKATKATGVRKAKVATALA